MSGFRALANEELQGYDACFFCLGVSSAGMTEADYTHLTYDLTLGWARVLSAVTPAMAFIYVSGMGTGSKAMWAQVKKRTEDALLALFSNSYMFRLSACCGLCTARSRRQAGLANWIRAFLAARSAHTRRLARDGNHLRGTRPRDGPHGATWCSEARARKPGHDCAWPDEVTPSAGDIQESYAFEAVRAGPAAQYRLPDHARGPKENHLHRGPLNFRKFLNSAFSEDNFPVDARPCTIVSGLLAKPGYHENREVAGEHYCGLDNLRCSDSTEPSRANV